MPESPSASMIETGNLPENCPKSTEMAITVCKFSKIFMGACPRTPLESFLLLKLLELNSAEKKTMLEIVTKFDSPSLKNFLNMPLI